MEEKERIVLFRLVSGSLNALTYFLIDVSNKVSNSWAINVEIQNYENCTEIKLICDEVNTEKDLLLKFQNMNEFIEIKTRKAKLLKCI